MSSAVDVTRLLGEWRASGSGEAFERVLPAVYGELRKLARGHLASERPSHTLQPTALVHETYLRLVASPLRDWVNRRQFFAVAGRLMRSLLIDHARARKTRKRGGDVRTERLGSHDPPAAAPADAVADLLALDTALGELAAVDARKHKTIQLRFLAGMTIDETAETLGVSAATVILDTRLGRAWLHRALCRRHDGDGG